tara:strand:- start:133 stop:348 length:216 start_codon:yes stop_codon:yes gene_type:complete
MQDAGSIQPVPNTHWSVSEPCHYTMRFRDPFQGFLNATPYTLVDTIRFIQTVKQNPTQVDGLNTTNCPNNL